MLPGKPRSGGLLVQYGAIPIRADADGGLQILLVTSRETHRWVVPRGNPISGLTPHDTAAQEAFEEAGVLGAVSADEVGSYRYEKRRKDGALVPAKVLLFRLTVAEELSDWPERLERERRWFGLSEAAAAVEEPDLRALLGGLGRGAG